MVSTNRKDYPASEVMLVASGNQAFPASGNLFPNSGNSVGLANGQLAVVNNDMNAHIGYGEILTATNNPAGTGVNTFAHLSSIKVVQGTPSSADISGLNSSSAVYGHQPYVSSRAINANSPLTFVNTIAQVPNRNAFLIGNITSGADSIPTLDNAMYQMSIGVESRRRDKVFGTQNTDVTYAKVTTPLFSSIALTTAAQKTDWIYQNMVFAINANSKAIASNPNIYTGNKPFIAFALDIDGSGTGTALSAITAGTPFNFMVRNGQTLSYTPDAAFVATIAKVIANSTPIVNATEIGVVNLTTAGAQTHDAILIVSLDEAQAVVYDIEPTNKVRLRIGMNQTMYGATNSTRLEEVCYPTEGQGLGRHLRIDFLNRAQKMIWSREWAGENTALIQTPNYIVEGSYYNVAMIEHREDLYVNYSHIEQRPHRLYILVPATSVGVGEANTVTSLNTILAPIIRSSTQIERITTTATSPSLFV